MEKTTFWLLNLSTWALLINGTVFDVSWCMAAVKLFLWVSIVFNLAFVFSGNFVEFTVSRAAVFCSDTAFAVVLLLFSFYFYAVITGVIVVTDLIIYRNYLRSKK